MSFEKLEDINDVRPMTITNKNVYRYILLFRILKINFFSANGNKTVSAINNRFGTALTSSS